MKRNILITVFTPIVFVAVLFGVIGCKRGRSTARNPNGKINVTTTIFPPYDFVRQIAGDKVNLTMLLPPGAESHSFEPSPRDIITVQNSDIFIYVGGDSDTWIDRILESMDTSKMNIIRMMDVVDVVEEEIVEGMQDDDDHGHGEFDPANVKDRPLSDFAGSWISGVPFLRNSSLDSYIAHHAEEEGESLEEAKAKMIKSWETDYDNITVTVAGLTIGSRSAAYTYRGYEIVEGHHGTSVWYKYQINTAASGFPAYLIFNDHGDGNKDEHHGEKEDEGAAHIHLKYGNDDFASIFARKDWSPMYFTAGSSANEILAALAGHGHEEEVEYDEHVWTSPRNAILIVKAITELLCEADSANADFYRQNASAYIKSLEELDSEFTKIVAGAKRKTIVFGDRFPFRYFADAYGLSYFAAFPGCSTETEPSAATVAFLINKIRDEKIPVVFHIELSNERMADTISAETGAKKRLLHAGHNISKKDFDSGLDYLEIMRRNTESLREALY